MTDKEPRAVRRGRVRMTRGGRKGARASVVVARHEAGVLLGEIRQAAGALRARDRRNGAASLKQRRPDPVRAKDKADRREYRRRAAAHGRT